MKKLFLLPILAILILGSIHDLFAQARRFDLIEHFTQASCSPCAQQNPFLQAILNVNRGSVNHIAYHTSWPGVDPMNAYNPTEVAARVTYYGVSGVPDCFLQGNMYEGGPAGITQNMLSDVSTDPSPIRILVKETSNGTERTVKVTVYTLGEVPAASYKLRAAVCEKWVHYATPPGSNGEKDFPDVFRKALPNSSGDTYTAAVVGDSVVFTYTYILDMAHWDTTQIYTIAYIQNETTKEVLNTGSSFSAGWEFVPLDACFYKGAAGETKPFHYQLMNFRSTPIDVKVKIISDQPDDWGISFEINSVVYEDSALVTIPAGGVYDMIMNVDIGSKKAMGNYVLSMAEPGSADYDPQSLNAYVISGVYELIVNNDGSWGDGSATSPATYQQNYAAGLDLAGSDYYAITRLGALYKASKYNCLTGVNNYYFNIGWSFPALTDVSVALLTSELNLGKNLFISGQDIGWDTWTSSSQGGHMTINTKAFYTNFMNAQFLSDGVAADDTIVPEPSDSVFGAMDFSKLYNVYGGSNFFPDELKAVGLGMNIFYYDKEGGKVSGVRSTNGTWKVVYLAPSLEQVKDTNVRKTIIKISHDWFGGPSTGIADHRGAVSGHLLQNYPNPVSGTTTVEVMNSNTGMRLEVLDIAGRLIRTYFPGAGEAKVMVVTDELKSGSYLYRLVENGRVLETKMMTVIH